MSPRFHPLEVFTVCFFMVSCKEAFKHRKMMKALLLIALSTLASCRAEENRQFWMTEGQRAMKETMKLRANMGVAKNVILFLGDGMGVPTITAARILKGQLEGGTGEEYRLEMEKFPYTGLTKTYNTNQQTPDSAGTATAFLSGVKTRAGVLGVDQSVVQGNCSLMPRAELTTILNWALQEGKSVGVVSTARITHATPGASYAKIPHRDWESDFDMGNVTECNNVKDIARQLVENNHNVQVFLGGGRQKFLPTSAGGERKDGRDLVQVWKDKQSKKGVKHHYVKNRDELKRLPSDTEFLFGLFQDDHMNYDADRKETGPDSEPSITEMFEAAHQILKKNDKGFFLLVEGGRIDHAHHKNVAHQALLDTIAFDKAITSAVSRTDEKDTLMLVTADHSHVFTIAGYPIRGHNILDTMTYKVYPKKSKTPLDTMPMSVLMYANGPGPQRTNLTNVDTSTLTNKNQDKKYLPSDGLPMTVLQYTNGPGPQRKDLSKVDTTVKDFKYPNGVPTHSETHGGEDVVVFARGPMSHLVVGVHEQNVLAHIMSYATCIGFNKDHCTKQSKQNDPNAALSNSRVEWKILVLGLLLFVLASLGSRW